MDRNRHIVLQCEAYNIIELDQGLCGQFLYWDTSKWFWKSWKKKFFQYQEGRLHIWKIKQSHKKCKKINIKSSTTITGIDLSRYLGSYWIYKFSIFKGNGKYQHTFASPRRDKILILWNQINNYINSQRCEDDGFPC